MALNTVSSDRLSTNVKTSNLGTELKGKIGQNKNLIVNGAMQVAQRGTSASGTGYKTVDRFTSQGNGGQAVTQSQDTDVPAGQGFSKSLKFDCTTANASPSAGNYLAITYRIEAQDLQNIANGTSNAKKLTLSFWVKSPKTGNHAVGLYKADSTVRQNTKTYSVSSANTWEKKTITFDGDTSGGGISNDNGLGIQIDWHLMAGTDFTSVDSTSWVNYSDSAWAYGHAVNVVDNTANNFYLTGVQLEVGSVATDFEHRSYGQELALCQRYFYMHVAGTNVNGNDEDKAICTAVRWDNSNFYGTIFFPVYMRAKPTISSSLGTDRMLFYKVGSTDGVDSIGIQEMGYANGVFSFSGGLTSSAPNGWMVLNNNDAYIGFTAEL